MLAVSLFLVGVEKKFGKLSEGVSYFVDSFCCNAALFDLHL